MSVERWFVTRDAEVLPYDPAVHWEQVYKFLYFKSEREMLLVSPMSVRYHMGVLDYYVIGARISLREKDKLKMGLRGAGMRYPSGGLDWSSEGFELDTPAELQPRIKELLTEQGI